MACKLKLLISRFYKTEIQNAVVFPDPNLLYTIIFYWLSIDFIILFYIAVGLSYYISFNPYINFYESPSSINSFNKMISSFFRIFIFPYYDSTHIESLAMIEFWF